MNAKKYLGQLVVLILFLLATSASVYLGTHLTKNAIKLKQYKHDLFAANQLKDGLLNGRSWSIQVERIIEQRIDSFSFSSKNKQVLRREVSGVMHRLLDQVDHMVHEKQDKLKDKVKMGVVRWMVDVEKIRAKIPDFANTVVAELDKRSNKDKVKDLVKAKVNELLISDSSLLQSDQYLIIRKHKQKSLWSLNRHIHDVTTEIEAKQRVWGYQLIAIMVLVLLLWIVLIKANFRHAFALAFMFSVVVSFVNLYIGINLPMLEIDARISQLDLEILHSHVIFYDQILFYQSKSIWDVATILITNGKIDSIFVGSLILLFSVFFPAMKLISASIHLFSKKKNNQFIKVMAFKSGKWSMADVMVVAIFIAYIGFQSIITGQLDRLSMRANEGEMVNLMTTNRSNLQIGFLVFVSFALFNLFLAVILKRVTRDEGPTSGALHLREAYQTIRRKRIRFNGNNSDTPEQS